jgi:hypothetical protein
MRESITNLKNSISETISRLRSQGLAAVINPLREKLAKLLKKIDNPKKVH